MYWIRDNYKTYSVINAVRRAVKEFLQNPPQNYLQQIIKLFQNMDVIEDIPTTEYTSAVFPLEIPKEYPIKILPKTIDDKHEILNFLSDNSISVSAIDSSSYNPGPHISIPIIVVNTGYWYMNYSNEIGGEGTVSEGFYDIANKIDELLMIKDVEYKAVRLLSNKLKGEYRFIFLDESLSITYTLAWARNKRKEMALKLQKIIEYLSSKKIIPVGIFYTRLHDIVRSLSTQIDMKIDQLPKIPDTVLMNYFLRKIGSRSPLFLVHSRALHETRLKLICFYLKLSDRNVIRVELPHEYAHLADDIQRIVFFQSVLGNGYPLALQRAHDIAALKGDIRKLIEEEIISLTKKPSIEYLLSRKASAKRWPIV